MKNLNVLKLGVLLILLAACNAQTVKTNSNVEDPEGPVEQSGTDVLAAQSWHLNNMGQNSFAGSNGTAGQDFNIAEVIDMGYRGAGVKIAVSDTGVDIRHEDLNDNDIPAYHRDYSSAVSSDWQRAGASPMPDLSLGHPEGVGHGTAVAGLIAAEGWNTIGSRGVAPEAKYAGFRFIGDFGDTTSSYEAKTLDQIIGNFDIFNYSYGYVGCTFVPVEKVIVDAYKLGVTSLRAGKGAVYVKSAGNDYIGFNEDCYGASDTSNYLGNTNTNEDQNVPYVVITAAVNAKGQISSYSTPGSGVWISSAGGEFGYASGSTTTYGNRTRALRGPAMVTTDIKGCAEGFSTSTSTESQFNKGNNEFNTDCDYTSTMNGTSSAAPVLSGVVALMLEANPNLTWRDVKHILAETAQKINYSPGILPHPGGNELSNHYYDHVYVTNTAGYSFSNTYGFGRVDANAAVIMALAYATPLGTYQETFNPNNDGWYYGSGVLALPIPDEDSTGISSVIMARHNYIIESVQIKVSTDHTFIGDLGVELVSPTGTRSKLLLINSNIKDSGMTDYMLLSNAFFGETSRGNWKINLIDGAADDTGDLTGWALKINGHKVSTSDSVAPLAPTALSHSPTDPSIVSSPAVTFTNSVSTDVMRYDVSIGTTPTDDTKARWFSIGLTNSFTVSGMSLTGSETYYIRVRAVDTSENVSNAVTSSWQAGL